MNRKSFLKKSIPAATLLPALIDGYSIRAFAANNSLLQAAFLPPVDTDHVLVIVQLSGGNDGLNMVIPVSTYSAYYNARQNIAIPETKILKLSGTDKTGLHPSMTGLQALYNEARVNIIQAVGYPQPSFSHFRATDIWMSASDSNTTVNSGWGGRYLDSEFPNYPAGYPSTNMPDPLAIQIGSVTSLTCQGPVVNMGMGITDPASFYNLVDGVQDPAPNTPMGYELSYIRQVARQTNKYADRVKGAANSVSRQVTYPSNNYLGDQLKIVARLIRGGLKTRIYMVSYGGFDTHASQVVAGDTTTGTHATLLGNVSSAIKAFMDDLKFLGIEERVVGMTFSEFGRRTRSNASGGTDHGAAAPMFVFGKEVVSGITGNNPSIPANVTVSDNIPFQYDFRSIYASVLQQWFCVPADSLQQIMMKNFQVLNLVNNKSCPSANPVPPADNMLISNYPNPFTSSTTITFTTRGGHTLVQIIDTAGQAIKVLLEKEYAGAGTHTVTFESTGLAAGIYYARLQNGPVQQVRTMLKVR
jgi:uncharacterized protein (DUF1501 family)